MLAGWLAGWLAKGRRREEKEGGEGRGEERRNGARIYQMMIVAVGHRAKAGTGEGVSGAPYSVRRCVLRWGRRHVPGAIGVFNREAKLIPPPDLCEKHARAQKTKLTFTVILPAAVWWSNLARFAARMGANTSEIRIFAKMRPGSPFSIETYRIQSKRVNLPSWAYDAPRAPPRIP